MSETHLLGKYRGFGLFYDEDDDVFFSDLQERYPMKKEPIRTSIKGLKKIIDETIKLNANFKPFDAYIVSIGWGEDKKKRIPQGLGSKVRITGVKKDGGLMVEKTKNQHNTQINGDSVLELFVKDAASEKIGAELALIDAEIDLLIQKKERLYKKYKPLDLSFIEEITGVLKTTI
jgi:hypothetical protein